MLMTAAYSPWSCWGNSSEWEGRRAFVVLVEGFEDVQVQVQVQVRVKVEFDGEGKRRLPLLARQKALQARAVDLNNKRPNHDYPGEH
jgi:hypothetical protein